MNVDGLIFWSQDTSSQFNHEADTARPLFQVYPRDAECLTKSIELANSLLVYINCQVIPNSQ